jgi:cyclophilin family peptidyl-prolyl cis-trans isomerase/HEAT repeat protein
VISRRLSSAEGEPRRARARRFFSPSLVAFAMLAGATTCSPAAFAAAAIDPYRAIAIAEDQRRYADGELRGFLSHADPAVRVRAALAVGRLQDSTSVRDLLPLLHDASPDVRREAIFALGQIGHRSARSAVDSSLTGADVATADLAIEALGKLGDRAATARVASFLSNASPLLRGEAAVALWRLADSTALPALVAHHDDPDPDVRWRVIYALEKIAYPDRVVLISAIHAGDPDPLVRAHVNRTMGRQKSPRATAYLLQQLEDPEPAVVVNAIRALQQVADTTCSLCGPRLIQFLGYGYPYVRVTAATALADRFAYQAVDTVTREVILDSLAAHLHDSDAATRGAAARALIYRRGALALERVRPLLMDTSLVTRIAVLQSLDHAPLESALPLLEPRLGPSNALLERMTAAEALGSLKARPMLQRLRSGLADTSMLYIAACAGALEAIGDSSSVPALAREYAQRAADADADARISIRDALRTLAGRAYADSLERRHPSRNALPTSYAKDFQDPPAVRGAVITTTAGRIEWEFYPHEAPQTVRNFVRLAERGYFDGLVIHRVVPDFVIQDGDPTGTGSGGPGYTIRCEYNRLRYDAGMVGMALSGKDTGGSQWFITHSPQPHLNGKYTIFAHVTSGMDVVRRIVQGDRVLRVEVTR